jgi:predicted RNA-binding protein
MAEMRVLGSLLWTGFARNWRDRHVSSPRDLTEGSGVVRFWLAVASDLNCKRLSEMGHPFYALSGPGYRLSMGIERGDLLLLYRAKRNSGFVGTFEATGNAIEETVYLPGVLRSFRVKIPWKPQALCENLPVRLPPLVRQLSFIANKDNYGMSLRSNLRELSKHDFRLIESAVQSNAVVTA